MSIAGIVTQGFLIAPKEVVTLGYSSSSPPPVGSGNITQSRQMGAPGLVHRGSPGFGGKVARIGVYGAMTRRLAFLALFALPACSHALGYAGSHPGEVSCKGKGTVTGMGNGVAGAGIMGSEVNSFSISFDCGPDGAYLKQGMPTADPLPKP